MFRELVKKGVGLAEMEESVLKQEKKFRFYTLTQKYLQCMKPEHSLPIHMDNYLL